MACECDGAFALDAVQEAEDCEVCFCGILGWVETGRHCDDFPEGDCWFLEVGLFGGGEGGEARMGEEGVVAEVAHAH